MFVLGAIFALGLLIVVHEAGHYFVARWCGMRIERFSIGIGPAIWKYKSKKTGTLFQVAPLLFGGFVEIRGMNIAEDVDPDDTTAYPNRPAWQRFLTILAGPATNWVSAIVLAVVLYGGYGVRSTERWFAVDSITATSDAKGKLQPGDRLLAVDGVPIWFVQPDGTMPDGDVLIEHVNAHPGEPVTVTFERDGKQQDVTLSSKPGKDKEGKPLLDKKTGKPIYQIGIARREDYDRVAIGPLGVMKASFVYPVRQSELILTGLWRIVSGKDKPQFSSAVGITSGIAKALENGMVDALELLMLLSVYLGIFNLLPLPALDGGRLVFLTYELVTRRRPNPKIETTVHMVGIMLLGIAIILITFGDIRRLFS